MKVCVVGTGYVGLVTGTCLAEMGNDVICIDNNPEKINALNAGHVPIYEPGLEELIRSNCSEKRLHFSTDLQSAVQTSDICFIAVGTPQGDDGSADLTAVFAVAKAIAQNMTRYTVLVTKSTVPVGTADKVKALVAEHTQYPFSVVSNPEFLKQGAAVEDFLKPDRVVIGTEPNDSAALEAMNELYSPFLRTGNPIIAMDIRSAEMTKYVANAFLATKISFINEMSQLCEVVGADINKVRVGISTDQRIGSQFLFPGLGYGGSCFPKDVKALIRTAHDAGMTPQIIDAVDATNKGQRQHFLDTVLAYYNGNVTGKTFGFWGLAFKPRTDDLREAPSIMLAEALLERGATILAFDPKAMDNCKAYYLGNRITYTHSAYDAAEAVDALLLITEWNEFRRPNFERLKALMKHPVLFDGRNQHEPARMAARGFDYLSVGRAPELAYSQATPATPSYV